MIIFYFDILRFYPSIHNFEINALKKKRSLTYVLRQVFGVEPTLEQISQSPPPLCRAGARSKVAAPSAPVFRRHW